MTSPDLGSAFTVCPDHAPKLVQVWFSAPITCTWPTVAETVALLALRRCFFPSVDSKKKGFWCPPYWLVMIPAECSGAASSPAASAA